MRHGSHTARRVTLALTFTALLVAGGCAPAPQPNLLSNPSFEGGMSGTPTYWQRDVFRQTSTLTWDDSVVFAGQRSIRISSETPNDARWIQTVRVKPYTLYELSGWIRTENTTLSEQAVSAGANLSLMGTFTYTEPLLGTHDWTYRRLVFNSGDSQEVTIAARVGFYSGISSGTAWFDNLRLRAL
jgi:hypothetical protein